MNMLVYFFLFLFFFFKQKTAYEMRISDWSSDVCSSDLLVSLEPKALGNIKPWVQGERTPNLVQGALRRSDGKVYRASNVPSAGGSPNYTETGNVRPIHEIGKEWDGPGDSRTFDTIN